MKLLIPSFRAILHPVAHNPQGRRKGLSSILDRRTSIPYCSFGALSDFDQSPARLSRFLYAANNSVSLAIMTNTTETIDVLKEKLEDLLIFRDYPKTICPSEVPRGLTPDELNAMGALTWRDLMPFMRQIVWDLREKQDVEILQQGKVLEGYLQLSDVKGPIRVRRRAM